MDLSCGVSTYCARRLFVTGLIAVAFAVSGPNTLNCFIDRDIDSMITRTRGRPLVLGTISPSEALGFSGVTMRLAAVLAYSLGTVPVILLVEGAGSYLLLYSVHARNFKKRKDN